MALTSLNRLLLGAAALSLGVTWRFGARLSTAVASIALHVAAIIMHRRPPSSLTVQDRCIINVERLTRAPTKAGIASGGIPGGGSMAVCMYIATPNMPDVALGRRAMARVLEKFPRFSSVAVEGASLEDAHFRTVTVDLDRHVVERALPSEELEAALSDLINAEMPREIPLWSLTLLRTDGEQSCVLLRASHALGDGLRFLAAASEFFNCALSSYRAGRAATRRAASCAARARPNATRASARRD